MIASRLARPLLLALVLAGAGAAPAQPPEEPAAVTEFLLDAAAADFAAHAPKPVRVRDVQLRHRGADDGDGPGTYLLCGRFQPVGEDTWVEFATIRTEGHEQWLGAQGGALCAAATPVEGAADVDLAAALQARLDARMGAAK